MFFGTSLFLGFGALSSMCLSSPVLALDSCHDTMFYRVGTGGGTVVPMLTAALYSQRSPSTSGLFWRYLKMPFMSRLQMPRFLSH